MLIDFNQFSKYFLLQLYELILFHIQIADVLNKNETVLKSIFHIFSNFFYDPMTLKMSIVDKSIWVTSR